MRTSRRRYLLASALLAAWQLGLFAQDTRRYEVASVKANTSGERAASMRFTPAGDFTAVNQPLRVIIQFAYQLPLFRVEGMPDWFTDERFDFAAKAPAGVAGEPLPALRARLLKALLEDRFTLKARLVTKEVPVMALTLVRADGRLGPQLRPSDVDCEAVAAARASRAGGPPAAPAVPARPVCALGGGSGGPICGGAITFDQLATGLAGVFQRPVLDRTGLTGRFDFDLNFTPDNPGGPGIAFGNRCVPIAGDRPALSTAMQEQLGLKLEAQRAPMEVLVIDSAERPTDN